MIDIPDFIYPKHSNFPLTKKPCDVEAIGPFALCPRCKKLVAQCDCPSIEPIKQKSSPIKPSVRLDKGGRIGKVVTLIAALPRNEAYLKDLAKQLKVKTGSGGTFYIGEQGGTIELQGDHRDVVREFFRTVKLKERFYV